MAAGSLARMAEMSAPTRASPRSASVQARRSSSRGKKESFDLANLQDRTSPRQEARSSVPRICFLTLAPSKGEVSKPSASSLNLAKIRASLAASSSVYDGCGGCGAPGSGRSVWDCCCWGAAEAEYQLLGADGRRVAHAVRRAAARRALADVSMARPSPAVRRPRGAILAAIVGCRCSWPLSTSQGYKALYISTVRRSTRSGVVFQGCNCCARDLFAMAATFALQGGVSASPARGPMFVDASDDVRDVPTPP